MKKFIKFLPIFLLTFFAFKTHAETLYFQPTGTLLSNNVGNGFATAILPLNSAISSVINSTDLSLDFKIKLVSGGQIFKVEMYECASICLSNGSNWSSVNTRWEQNTSGYDGTIFLTSADITFGSGFTTTVGKYYVFALGAYGDGGASDYYYGDSSSVGEASTYLGPGSSALCPAGSYCNGISSIAGNISTPTPSTPDLTSSPILTTVFPPQGYSTTSTSTMYFQATGTTFATSTLSFSFVNQDDGNKYSTSTVILPNTNFNIRSTTWNYVYFDVNSCGNVGNNCNAEISTSTLTEGFYKGVVTITGYQGGQDYFDLNFTVGSSSFSTVPAPNSGNVVTGGGGSWTVSTSTSGLKQTNLLSFLNVPNLLQTKFPFAYIPQIYSAITQGLGTSTLAENFPSATLSMPWFLSPTSSTTLTVTLFSSSTVTHFLPQQSRDIIRAFLILVIWWEWGMFIWHDIRHRKHLI